MNTGTVQFEQYQKEYQDYFALLQITKSNMMDMYMPPMWKEHTTNFHLDFNTSILTITKTCKCPCDCERNDV